MERRAIQRQVLFLDLSGKPDCSLHKPHILAELQHRERIGERRGSGEGSRGLADVIKKKKKKPFLAAGVLLAIAVLHPNDGRVWAPANCVFSHLKCVLCLDKLAPVQSLGLFFHRVIKDLKTLPSCGSSTVGLFRLPEFNYLHRMERE